MTLETGLILAGFTTVMIICCIYSTVINDRLREIAEFTLFELVKIQANNGYVLAFNKETGELYFLDADEYLNNKDGYEIYTDIDKNSLNDDE